MPKVMCRAGGQTCDKITAVIKNLDYLNKTKLSGWHIKESFPNYSIVKFSSFLIGFI